MKAIGIDPGKTGAFAVIGASPWDTGHVYGCQDLPWTGKDLDVTLLQTWLRWLKGGEGCRVIVERQQAYPKQGGVSNFTIGYGYGQLTAILLAEGIPFEAPTPSLWHKEVGIPQGTDKAGIRMIAARLYPTADLGTRKDQGRADALMIAECLRRRITGG